MGYCTGCTKYQPNSNFCLNCGKPIAPQIKKKGKKGYRIICPYCEKDYAPNYYEKHVKNVHSEAILRHFRRI